MNTISNIPFCFWSNDFLSQSSSCLLSSVTPQMKKIFGIAAIAIGLLAACFYTAVRWGLFKAKPLPNDFVKDRVLSEDPVTKVLRGFHHRNCAGIIHGIYLTTNESGLEETKDFLTKTPQINQGCHIGCAGWHNFDIMVLRKSAYGLILDFNPENKKLMEETLTILKESTTREIFVEKMGDYLDKKLMKFCPKVDAVKGTLTAKEEMMVEFKREGSWLAKEESYDYIRKLALKDKIAAITEDIRNTKRLAEIPDELNKFGVAVDTIYLSNICIFMNNQKDKAAFTATLEALIHPKAIVINCPRKTEPSFPGEDISNPLQQVASLGEEFQGDCGREKFFKI